MGAAAVSAATAHLEAITDIHITDDQMGLEEAVVGLKAYKEVDERMVQLWHNLDTAVMSPRMNIAAKSLPSIKHDNVSRRFQLLTGVC